MTDTEPTVTVPLTIPLSAARAYQEQPYSAEQSTSLFCAALDAVLLADLPPDPLKTGDRVATTPIYAVDSPRKGTVLATAIRPGDGKQVSWVQWDNGEIQTRHSEMLNKIDEDF